MALTKHIYRFEDLVEQDIDTAPSLDLSDINVDKYYVPKDNGKYMLFCISFKPNVRPEMCDVCKSIGFMNSDGNGSPRLLHDISRNNHRVDIVLLPKRFKCKLCGAKITPSLQGVEPNRQATTRLIEYLQTECFLQSHTALSERSGFSIETIQNIMDEEIEKYEANRKQKPLDAPRVLGIDEKHIENDMCGTFVDVENGQLLDMVNNNNPETMQNAIKNFKGWNTNIQVITTDMSNAYIRWLPELLPNATIVIDKFHVMQDVQNKVSTTKKNLYNYRKNLIKQIEDPEDKTRQNVILQLINTDNRLFNYSLNNISRDENSDKAKKLLTVIEEFPEFRLLRKLLNYTELMYQQENLDDATLVWNEWMKWLPPAGDKQYQEWCDLYSIPTGLFDDFRSFARPGFQFFKKYILNYFKPGCRYTNAATEGINTLIERINRDGNGLSFRSLRAKSLYASLIHERKQYGIDMKTIKAWKPTIS